MPMREVLRCRFAARRMTFIKLNWTAGYSDTAEEGREEEALFGSPTRLAQPFCAEGEASSFAAVSCAAASFPWSR